MKRINEICVIALIILIIGITASYAVAGTSNTDALRIRKEPATSSDVLETVNKGTKLEVIEKTGDWYKVKYDDIQGYAYADYVDTTETPADTGEVAKPAEDKYPKSVSTESSLKIYIIPVITSSVTGNISKGTKITVNKVLNGWAHITYNQQSGWIRNSLIGSAAGTAVVEDPEDEKPLEAANTSKIRYVIVEEAIVRDAPNGNIAEGLKYNTQVTIVGEDGDWYKIEYLDGAASGYMAKRLLSETKGN